MKKVIQFFHILNRVWEKAFKVGTAVLVGAAVVVGVVSAVTFFVAAAMGYTQLYTGSLVVFALDSVMLVATFVPVD